MITSNIFVVCDCKLSTIQPVHPNSSTIQDALSIPHVGQFLPSDVDENFNPEDDPDGEIVLRRLKIKLKRKNAKENLGKQAKKC